MNFLNPASGKIENILRMPVIFSLVVMYQGIFSHNAIYVPDRVMMMFDYTWFRVFSLFIIALVVTSDVETALISSLIFAGSLYALKTPEERKKTGFI
jgi:hypothetical protein